MSRKTYADRTEHIIPCTRKITPNDKNADHHKRAEKLHHTFHPIPLGPPTKHSALGGVVAFRLGSSTHISADQIKESPHATHSMNKERAAVRPRSCLSRITFKGTLAASLRRGAGTVPRRVKFQGSSPQRARREDAQNKNSYRPFASRIRRTRNSCTS